MLLLMKGCCGYEEIINNGGLIPDEDVIRLMDKQIKKAEDEGFDVILDGYPRDKAQAEYIMNNMADKIDGIREIDLAVEKPVDRALLLNYVAGMKLNRKTA